MALRTVGVRLTAEVSGYARGMKGAGAATDSLKDGIEDTARSATKLDGALGVTGATAKAAGREVDGLGGDFRDTARDARALKSEIQEVERSLAGLALEFAATSRASDRIDLTKSIRRQQGELHQLLAVQKLLPSPGEVEPVARGFGKTLISGIGSGLQASPLSPQLTVAVGAAAVAVAPLLGAALSGAIIGGAGIGGVVGGLALASRDARVKAAFSDLGTDLQGRLNKAAGGFVEPAIEGIHQIEDSLDSINFEGIFADASQYVEPLTRGIGSAISSLGNGIEDLVHNAGPVVGEIADGIASIGDHLGEGLSSLAKNGPAAAAALRDVFAIIDGSLDATFSMVNALTEIYKANKAIGGDGALQLWFKVFGEGMDRSADGARRLGSGTFGASAGINALTGSATAAVPPVVSLDEKLRDAAAAARSLYSATTDAAGALATATKTIKDNGKALSLHTQKGRENRAALADVAAAFVRQHDAAVAANGENAKSAKISSTNRAAFERLAQKAGYSADKARDLAKSLGLIPTRRETQIKADTREAEANVRRVNDLLAGIHNKTVSVNVVVRESQARKVNNTLDRLGARAQGGPVMAGQAYLVGEHQPEVFVPDTNGKIVSSVGKYRANALAPVSGLVNFAPSTATAPASPRGSRLDTAEAMLAARDAVAQLTRSLKENGRTWSWNTAKGRENRSTLISGIKAAQNAAEAKYAETGSIKAANKVYDDYIKQLDASMRKMKVNAATRKALIKAYSERPHYDIAAATPRAPSNSSALIKATQDHIAIEDAVTSTKAAFAWTKPTFNLKTETGRAELTQLFSFLSTAAAGAQSMFDYTGNAKQATGYYNGYISQLRDTLIKSGMAPADVDKLLKQYGKITLEPKANRWGGLYQHAEGGLLNQAMTTSGGPTRYAWSEPSTGGELFAPRNGNLAKTRAEVGWAVQNWWGGQVQWGGSAAAAAHKQMVIQATIPITLGAETITRHVNLAVDMAVGKVVDAAVYS